MGAQIEKKLTKAKAVLALVIAGIISVIIAVAWVEYGAIELGAIFYFIIPVIVTIVAIIAFFIFDSFSSISRKQLALILAIIILLTGVFMRLDFYYGITDCETTQQPTISLAKNWLTLRNINFCFAIQLQYQHDFINLAIE